MTVGWPVTVRVAGVALDPCRVALPLQITHGRSSVGTQPDAPACEFVWLGSTPPGALGDQLDVDAAVDYNPAVYDSGTVTYDDPAAVYDSDPSGDAQRARFRGLIAGLVAQELDGQVTSWRVECVGHLARLGFQPVNTVRPQETDTARVAALCAAAGVPIVVRGASTIQLVGDAVDTDLLSALHDICGSAGGLLWQTPAGHLVYGTSQHRSTDPVGVLDCEIIGDGVSWAENVEQIINRVTVSWPVGEGTQQSTFTDSQSAAQPWGVRAVTVSTMCASESDAEVLAQLILVRNAWPFWSTPSALLHGEKMTPYDSQLLALLDTSVPVLVPIPDQPGSTPAALRTAIVEGLVETWDDKFQVQVALSDAARWVTTRPRTYQEVRTGGTYLFWAAGTYLDMLIVEA